MNFNPSTCTTISQASLSKLLKHLRGKEKMKFTASTQMNFTVLLLQATMNFSANKNESDS